MVYGTVNPSVLNAAVLNLINTNITMSLGVITEAIHWQSDRNKRKIYLQYERLPLFTK